MLSKAPVRRTKRQATDWERQLQTKHLTKKKEQLASSINVFRNTTEKNIYIFKNEQKDMNRTHKQTGQTLQTSTRKDGQHH